MKRCGEAKEWKGEKAERMRRGMKGNEFLGRKPVYTQNIYFQSLLQALFFEHIFVAY